VEKVLVLKTRKLLYFYFDIILCVKIFSEGLCIKDLLCGIVVRVLGYKSGSPDSIPCTTTTK
jgi:hypothetical protein